MEELISVIVPVYKTERYLRECIDSILAQSYKKLEVILIDDGSPDSCPQICDEYAEKDSRVIVIHQKNMGVSKARNSGLDIATGALIGFVDSDDTVDRDFFHYLLKLKNAYRTNISICHFYCEASDDSNKGSKSKERIYQLDQERALFFALHNNYYQGFLCNKLFSSELFNKEEKIRLNEDVNLCEDLLCLCRLIKRSNSIVYSTQPKYNYRLNNTGVTFSHFKYSKLTFIKAYKEIEKLAESYPKVKKLGHSQYVYMSLIILTNIFDSRIQDEGVQRLLISNIRRYWWDFISCGDHKLKHILGVLLLLISPRLYSFLSYKFHRKKFLK